MQRRWRQVCVCDFLGGVREGVLLWQWLEACSAACVHALWLSTLQQLGTAEACSLFCVERRT